MRDFRSIFYIIGLLLCIEAIAMLIPMFADILYNVANEYGNLFGLIFQIVDDYLDEVSDFKTIGKTPGKDKKQGKSTLIQYMNKKDAEYLINNDNFACPILIINSTIKIFS